MNLYQKMTGTLVLSFGLLFLFQNCSQGLQSVEEASSVSNSDPVSLTSTGEPASSMPASSGGTNSSAPSVLPGNNQGPIVRLNEQWLSMSLSGAPAGLRFSGLALLGRRVFWYAGNNTSDVSVGAAESGIYDPSTNTWAPINSQGAPSPRHHITPIWTGSHVIVWGGFCSRAPTPSLCGSAAFLPLAGGAIYNPATNTWTPMSTQGAPGPRGDYNAVWSGTEMLLFGGWGQGVRFNDGAIYNPATNTWRAMSQVNAPSPRGGASSVWTGTQFVVWGGNSQLSGQVGSTGGFFNPTNNTWSPTSLVNAPAGRYYHSTVWTGSRMIVFGGYPEDIIGPLANLPALNTGGSFDPATNTWTAISSVGAPALAGHVAVWTGTEMLVYGGRNNVNGALQSFNGLYAYNPMSNQWRQINVANDPGAMFWHRGVWTGTHFFVLGSRSLNGNFVTSGGLFH